MATQKATDPLTPNMQAVFAKWENRGPRDGGGDSSLGGENQIKWDQVGQLADKITQDGRAKWRERYGDSVRPMAHRRAKQRSKRPAAIPLEEMTSNVIAEFKSKPMITPESLMVTRPYMGKGCSCMPVSQVDFSTQEAVKLGFRNVLDLEIRGRNWKEKYFANIVYAVRKRTNHVYPDVSPVCEAIAQEDAESKADTKSKSVSAEKRAQRIVEVMKSTMTGRLTGFVAWILTKIFPNLLRAILVHKGQIDVIKRASERGLPMIYLPLHRSHLDYVLMTFIFWHYKIKTPYVAAGINLNIPVFGPIMKSLGGFFIRRKLDKKNGKKDMVYRSILHIGLPKKPETFIGAIKALLKVCRTQYGCVRVDFCQPFSLKEYLQNTQSSQSSVQGSEPNSDSELSPDSDPSTPPVIWRHGSMSSLYGTDVGEENRQLVKSLAEHITYTGTQSTALMSTNLLAFLLLKKHRQGVEKSQLAEDMDWLISELKVRQRDVGFTGEPEEVIHYASLLLGENLVTRTTESSPPAVFYKPNKELAAIVELSYYSNAVLSPFVLESVISCAVISCCDVSLDNTPGHVTCSATREEILATAVEICQLLQYEFIFVSPCKQLEEVLAEELDQMICMEIIQVKETLCEDQYSTYEKGWAQRLSANMEWRDEEDEDDLVFQQTCQGLPKKPETFIGAIKALLKVCRTQYGCVRVDFCQPFSLKEYLQNTQSSQSSVQGSEPNSDGELSPDSDPSTPPVIWRHGSMSSLYGTDVGEENRQLVKSLAEHITYTGTQSTALMSTNLLAFLLLKKYRQGVEKSQLAEDMDWLISELKVRQRDVGFTGEPEEVIHYASLLLGENLVTRTTESSPPAVFYKPNKELAAIVELSYYSNAVLSPFVLESVISCAVISCCDVSLDNTPGHVTCSATREEILATAVEICQLLQYEFIFVSPCKQLEEVLAEELDQMICMEIIQVKETLCEDQYSTYEKGWAQRLSANMEWRDEEDEDDLVFQQTCQVNMDRPDCVEKLRFFHQVLAPFLESYYVTACQIHRGLHSQLIESDFLHNIHIEAKKRVYENLASSEESVVLDSLKNALKSFSDLKIIDIYCVGNLRMVELHDHFEVKEKLIKYIELLEVLKG
uniref:Glycerol-3-phosphate acyltransferase 1, mitochondrial n=1 Tax=Magallana gigas TaxID=29159 RepID=K1PMP0_MAGGI